MPTLEELDNFYQKQYDFVAQHREQYSTTVNIQKSRLYALLDELYGGKIDQLVRSGGRRIVELACGTNITWQLSASRWASEIVMTELAEPGRAEVQNWLNSTPGHFDWSQQVRHIAGLEGVTPEALEARLRAKISRVEACDVHDKDPLPGERESYDVAFSLFCLESACTDETNFRSAVANICSLLRPGGIAIFCGKLMSSSYMLGGEQIRDFAFSQEQLQDALQAVGMTDVQWNLLPNDEPTAKSDEDQPEHPNTSDTTTTWYMAVASKALKTSKE